MTTIPATLDDGDDSPKRKAGKSLAKNDDDREETPPAKKRGKKLLSIRGVLELKRAVFSIIGLGGCQNDSLGLMYQFWHYENCNIFNSCDNLFYQSCTSDANCPTDTCCALPTQTVLESGETCGPARELICREGEGGGYSLSPEGCTNITTGTCVRYGDSPQSPGVWAGFYACELSCPTQEEFSNVSVPTTKPISPAPTLVPTTWPTSLASTMVSTTSPVSLAPTAQTSLASTLVATSSSTISASATKVPTDASASPTSTEAPTHAPKSRSPQTLSADIPTFTSPTAHPHDSNIFGPHGMPSATTTSAPTNSATPIATSHIPTILPSDSPKTTPTAGATTYIDSGQLLMRMACNFIFAIIARQVIM